MKFGLKESVIEKICLVFKKFPEIEKAVLYGSRAKGNFRNGSDIDLTLFGENDLTLNKLYKIMDELDDLLLPYSFDLSIHSLIDDEEVLEHIQRVGVVFYQKG